MPSPEAWAIGAGGCGRGMFNEKGCPAITTRFAVAQSCSFENGDGTSSGVAEKMIAFCSVHVLAVALAEAPAQVEWPQFAFGHVCGAAANEAPGDTAGGSGNVRKVSTVACFLLGQSQLPLAHWPSAHDATAVDSTVACDLLGQSQFPPAHWPSAQTDTAVDATLFDVAAFSLQHAPSQHSLHGVAGGAAGGAAMIRSIVSKQVARAATTATANVDCMFILLHETGRKIAES